MAPIITDAPHSSSLWDKTSDFISRNKTAIALTALVATGATGAYIYYNSPSSSSASDKDKAKKKSSKKSAENNLSNNNSEAGDLASSDLSYPVDKKNLPNLTEEFIASLSDESKIKYSLKLKEEGNTKFSSKDYETAIMFYTNALKLKEDPVYYSNRSACYSGLDQNEKVIEDTTKALELKPDYSKCLLRRAIAYEKLSQFPEAMYDLTALTIYDGFQNKSVEPILERILKKHSTKIVQNNLKNRVPSLPTASSICSFFGAFKKDDPIVLSQDDTDSKNGLYYLSEALNNLDKSTMESYELADSYFSQAVNAFKDVTISSSDADKANTAVALEYLAAMKFLKNEPTDSLIDLDKALSLQPRSKTFVLKSLIAADKADFEEANSNFKKALELDDKNPDIFYHKGQMHYLTGELSLAETQFKKAKELNPSNLYAHIQLACIAYRNGSIDSAEKQFSQAKQKFPDSPEIPNYYGEILADRGKSPEAIKQFDLSSELQKKSSQFSVGAVPLINKATLVSREGLPESINKAAEILQEACDLDPKSELARITLAQIRLQQNKVEDAIKLFEESSDLARGFEEKVQATSFAEASKMQLKIKENPILSAKVQQMLDSLTGEAPQ
ncbi:protein channel TOM71 [Ascoidea rubescens DSM 1968]|uniref:Mitochondrial outer membrane specialized import receptor n=1 Tax=Ascoidea rubescens DSM 1968 TaxID=1344418 RepID=A0A1D2V9L6_9ASCO|nr:mitochondrial outer membrane specialized import receptor [Ascoidea rubescens DSM 1968]ODV58356.1 mitochondrial outer membrane specialized import receptor [Ascoidea rubescens DSM 1968]